VQNSECKTRRADPTVDEIRQLCLEIQRSWSDEERWKRLRPDLRPSVLLCDGRREDFSLEVYEQHHAQRQAVEV
jgi:hypothetical protein